ncbi:uncharacterized protein LOC110191932 [Drosophila serrata]|uniref:uncharacterized protein LOC110191932 n=1 Tax=Drosophila serrata TaxID=7274 RepID=UPI000A1D318F|nr:uncharacterized protein LOC110191932 [Drosophila serrata]
MYKHTVKSKLAQVRSSPSPAVAATPTHAPNKHGLGAGKKFFSHIRHKIEDNLTPKLSGKLYYKGSKHTRSMSALCTVDGGCVGGKYTPKGVPVIPVAPLQMSNQQMTSSVCSYVDSDEESHLSLSLSLAQQSLEDEIFAELEKVAHDESKLNEVLQSFDHILNEYPPLEGIPLVPAEELPAPPAEFCDRQPMMLAKSHSTLSIGRNRMQLYQSPELAGSILLLRGAGGDSRYNSLSDLSGSRIPVRKQSSLRKRSESFCLEQPVTLKPTTKQRTRSMLTLNTVARPPRAPAPTPASAHVSMPKRANSSLEQRQVTARPAARRANSTLKAGGLKSKSPNANSDELLVKCLAKGQEILRQVESMSSKPKRTGSRGVTKEHSQLVRNKKKLQKLQYANEEKVGRPKLESCKIIPPKLGETSDKNQELLVKVVQEVKTPTQAPLKKPTKEIRAEQEEDSDDSGHISNTQLSTSTSSTSNSTGSLCESEGDEAEEQVVPPEAKNCSKSNKIAELLQKFEAAALAGKQNTATAPHNHCPTVMASKVVAQVQAVRCIQTQVEIYPTYTKEVTMQLH